MTGQRHTHWLLGLITIVLFEGATAWGFFFDDRREISLSGFAYSRATFALEDGLAGAERTYYTGNLVQHRNFLTLEWRHNLNRVSREFPLLAPLGQFLNLDAFDYYLNMRTEYDGVWAYGPMKMRRMMGGTRLHAPYFDDPNTPTQFDGLYFTPFSTTDPNRHPWPSTGMRSADFPANVISLTNRRWLREFRDVNVRLFEWYFNITKGPLFIRIGRQNLSWGETDAFRLLDQINPLDNAFGGFLIPLDERRIPLNMLRAQWSFGTVGPIADLTLEGFYSVDNEIQQPGLPTSSVNYWGSIQNGTTAVMYGRTPCGGHYMEQRGLPPYDRDPLFPYAGSGVGPKRGGGCSVRGDGPHSNLEDGRGGGRIVGTIHDFTFSIAHYYTYQDTPVIRATIIAPTRDHLRWDLGLPTDSQGRPWADKLVQTPFGMGNTANPWGVEDPFAARAISSNANPFGRGAVGTVGGAERDVRSTVNYQRIQVTGASLSFPITALTGMFVGSDSPLYYLYTTFRSEIAFFRNYPTMQAWTHGDGGTAFNRFLGLGDYGPSGALANQAGGRTAHIAKRDWLLWVIGLDHNQWIRFLNPNNSFTLSGQIFFTHRNGQDTKFAPGPQGPLNDRDDIAGRFRHLQKPVTNPAAAATCQPGTGARGGCSLWKFNQEDWITTFSASTQYMGGNLRPSFVMLYDWSGSFLIQPGVDWTFWDPFRASVRYNYLDGRGNEGIGILNRKDNIWFELQYLLY
jgi:hypothetical protein